MSEIPRDLKYTKEHEWVRIDSDNVGIVGISATLQKQSFGKAQHVNV